MAHARRGAGDRGAVSVNLAGNRLAQLCEVHNTESADPFCGGVYARPDGYEGIEPKWHENHENHDLFVVNHRDTRDAPWISPTAA